MRGGIIMSCPFSIQMKPERGPDTARTRTTTRTTTTTGRRHEPEAQITPNSAKSDPKERPGFSRTGQGAAQEQPGRAQEGPRAPGAARSFKMSLRRRKMCPERGPGEAQKRLRGGPAYDTTGHKSREAKARRYKWRQEQKTRPEARRDNKLTKGLPGPLSPEPLGPYPTYFS